MARLYRFGVFVSIPSENQVDSLNSRHTTLAQAVKEQRRMRWRQGMAPRSVTVRPLLPEPRVDPRPQSVRG